MNFGRILLIIGVVLILVVVVFGVYYLFFRPSPTPPPTGDVGATPVVVESSMTQIVVAAQNIPRGMMIEEDVNAVILQSWPADAVPLEAVASLDDVYGSIARVDIVRGMPILESMLSETAGDVGDAGSDAALQIPEDKEVGYALPVGRYSSLAWALQPGDHVDVIISLLVVDLDEEFQSPPPNQIGCMSPPEGEGCKGGVFGRLETLPNGWVVNALPREGQRPRLVTQLTVQDAVVLQVGDWPDLEEALEVEEEAPPVEEGEAPPPTPPPDRVEPLTLAVTRQDAMVLDYALIAGARINLVLRRVGDERSIVTESVTLQYLLDRFSIELPPKLPYGLVPPISELDRIPRDESAAEYGNPESFSYTSEAGE